MNGQVVAEQIGARNIHRRMGYGESGGPETSRDFARRPLSFSREENRFTARKYLRP